MDNRRRRLSRSRTVAGLVALMLATNMACDAADLAGVSGTPVHAVADTAACGAKRLGSATVTTFNNVPMVNLLANQRPIMLILDTGAELTVLTPGAAARIGAQPPRIEINHRMRGIGGSLATREVEVTSLVAGDVPLKWRRLLVAPITIAKADIGKAAGAEAQGRPLDGLLGADELSDFDIDLDLSRRQIVFYEKQTCPNAAPDWTGRYSTIVAARSPAGHLFFPVQLEGRRVTAIIDTGAQHTTVSTATARAVGVSDAALALDRPVTARGVAGEQLSSRVHQFSRLEVGGQTIRNAEIIVTDLNLQDADIVLGADYLGARRLWLSYGSQRIFLSGP